jgi:hypothetical protein
MDTLYVMLLLIAGVSFYLQIEWLLLASIFIFFALIFARYYEEYSSRGSGEMSHAPAAISGPDAPSPGGQPQQPIIVMQSGGGGAATITDTIIANMMGHLMALDSYEKRDQAPWSKFLSRGMKMRQNMFDHHGKVATYHQGFDPHNSSRMIDKLDEISKKLDKKD